MATERFETISAVSAIFPCFPCVPWSLHPPTTEHSENTERRRTRPSSKLYWQQNWAVL